VTTNRDPREPPISTNRHAAEGTLLDRIIPRPSDRAAAIGLDVGLVAAGVVLMTIASQISIPWHPVPLTGGTFGVLLIGGLYGLRRAFLTLATFIGLGALGLGVFADWSGGWDVITGSTGGYIIGYLVAACMVGWYADHGASQDVMKMVGVMLIANATIYLFGVTWLAHWTPPGATQEFGWNAAYEFGIQPFVPGDIVKLFFAACLLPGGWKLMRLLERR
jgi:biotin transport system substrate-specific component